MGAVTEDKFIDIMLLTRIKPCVHLKFTKPIKQSSIFTCIVTFHIVSTTIVYNNNTTIDTYLKCGCAFVFFTKLTFTSIARSSFISILSSNVRYMVKPVSTYNIKSTKTSISKCKTSSVVSFWLHRYTVQFILFHI